MITLIFLFFLSSSLGIFCQINEIKIKHNGIERSFLYYLPKLSDKADYIGLFFILHGGGGNARKILSLTEEKFNKFSEKYKYIAVYPEGYKNHFNDGRKNLQWEAFKKNIDDVGFFKEIIIWFKKNIKNINDNIYFAGISNGGMMSFKAGCEMENVKGIASVSANLPKHLYGKCDIKGNPVIVIILNTRDPLMPYNGGEITGPFGARKLGNVVSAKETYDFFLGKKGCVSETEQEFEDPYDKGMKVIKYRSLCNSKILFYSVIGGGHTWPGGRQYLSPLIIGKTTSAIDASEEIVKAFFE